MTAVVKSEEEDVKTEVYMEAARIAVYEMGQRRRDSQVKKDAMKILGFLNSRIKKGKKAHLLGHYFLNKILNISYRRIKAAKEYLQRKGVISIWRKRLRGSALWVVNEDYIYRYVVLPSGALWDCIPYYYNMHFGASKSLNKKDKVDYNSIIPPPE